MLWTDVRKCGFGGTRFLLGVLLLQFFGYAPTLQAAVYPVIFKSATALRELGISVIFKFAIFGTHTKLFRNKCYDYGEGGYLISFSDEFFQRFGSKGFTVQSACLGLVSETRYDPETGRRLPTYIIVGDPDTAPEEVGNSEELPLDLPDCFKNGNPYSDCTFRFGRKTGKALSQAETELYSQLGVALDQVAHTVMKRSGSTASDEFYGDSDDSSEELRGFRKNAEDALFYETSLETIDEKLLRYSSARFLVRSAAFPRGYGYALDADGGADPSVSPEAVKAAADGLKRPQISVEELRRVLNSKK